MKKKLVLIDGNSIAYRAFFALPLLNNNKGIHTNAVYGFTTMLMKILEEEKPSHILVAFDAGKTTFRHSTFKEYKGGRQKTPPELSEQFPFIRELLDAYGISRYELENYEADDIIGTLSLEAEKNQFDVKIISGDKDLTQLSSEQTTVMITKKGITEMEEYTPVHIKEKYGLSVEQIVDMKGLMGDSSDNIPGVPGVGEKTAIKLLKQFQTVEELLNSIDQVSGKKLKEKLEDNKQQALMSKELATIIRDAPVEVGVKNLSYEGVNAEKLSELFKDLGFHSLLDKLDVEDNEEEVLDEINVQTLTEIKREHLTSPSYLYVEMLEENYHKGEILGIGLHNQTGTYFIPSEVAFSSDLFKDWVENESERKIVYDTKQTIVSFRRSGFTIKGIDFDVLISAYIINPSANHDDFASLAKSQGVLAIKTDEAVYGKGAKKAAPAQEIIGEHVGRKVSTLEQLSNTLQRELETNNQFSLLEELELPLAFILAEMELKGVKVNRERLQRMGEELNDQLRAIEGKIYELAGETFNINSPKQLGVILFEKLELPVIKKTKTGYSTSADVLEKLQSKHEIIDFILHYRQLGKLNSTYIEGLLKVVNQDTNKIHTRFNQVLTQTGRLSSIDPNLQNIPIRLEEGRRIRQAFVPSKPGWLMFAADYSQIELRVLAHIANDEKLIQAFKEGLDIHTKTAMDVFGVKQEEVTSNMRRHAKAVNFGIVYGISDYGLSQSLNITRKEAGKFIETYLNSFPGVKDYMDSIVLDAKQRGYVTTLLNRRRYIPEITSRNFNLKSFGERTAMNTPIQGSAADIIKKAMIHMAEGLKEKGLQTRLLLQVHDELIFEAPKEEIETLIQLVPEIMENAIELSVPLKVDYSYGETWYDAK
ncbi:DNA polymerase I [Bacillus spongiae]|uniref:DNA polymerase I n=1 Tax=Bacillus spongiae TaxID=2683610 RepID=A0ABU8H8C6_9BACI